MTEQALVTPREGQVAAEETLPVLPLRGGVLLPHAVIPISVGREDTKNAVEAALASEEKRVFVVAMSDTSADLPGPEHLHKVGTIGIITQMLRVPVPGLQLLVTGEERAIVKSFISEPNHLQARVTAWPLQSEPSPELEGLSRAVVSLAEQAAQLAEPDKPVDLKNVLGADAPADRVTFFIATLFQFRTEKIQSVLSAESAAEALGLLRNLLGEEIAILEVTNRITRRTASELSEQQRRHILEQQLATIRAELGEKTPEQAELELLRSRVDETRLPEAVAEEVSRELGRLERLPAAAQEYHVVRDRIELILDLPWFKTTGGEIDIANSREILNREHHDLDEVKNRILEHLGVLRLNPSAASPIICLVGPPGVGKTSIGQSIAHALGREFRRLSLGGMHDEAELRGHRRTYVGAMSGRIIDAIRSAGARDPVIMLDEVDKLGRDFKGDPAAALLEVLDPEQQDTFHDNYLDLPFDLSHVFFVTTANTLDTIPKPLLDRMEVLRLPGYTDADKLVIAERFLIPRQIERAGLKPGQLAIGSKTILGIVRKYTWEAGVRQLEQRIGSLARKVALAFAEGKGEAIAIKEEELRTYLGPPARIAGRRRTSLPAGVAAGLAWTEAGGDVLYVEATALPTGCGLTLTGHLGDVMKESAQAARSYLLSHARELGMDVDRVEAVGLHIHVPAGATPKDGPSAGVAMATAVASLLLGVPARSDTAMTGEITLTGLVLPVGGVREKVLGAARLGMSRVILPKDNEHDLEKLPDEVRDAMKFVFVESVDQVLQEALESQRRVAA